MIISLGERRLETRGDYWIAPDATVIGSVVLEQNVSIWFKVVIRGDSDLITIGENSNIQETSVLHADPGFPLTLGRNVSVGHMVMLHGCTIGENSLIGIGATILNGTVIGKNCLIGGHAFIAEGKVIPDGSLVIGAPGRVVRQLTDEQIADIRRTADHYVENFKRFRRDMKRED
ncbi:MAG: gamma carbonic anhydrase family protein [Burkholderiales bacterium]